MTTLTRSLLTSALPSMAPFGTDRVSNDLVATEGSFVVKGTCTFEDCGRPEKHVGWCAGHYTQWHKRGHRRELMQPLREPDPLVRFFARIDWDSDPRGCFRWTGSVRVRQRYCPDGYGSVQIGRKSWATHRLFYELCYGPVPEGLVLDHLCRNTICCNPTHLEAVTMGENTLRGNGPTAQNARKATCPRGHEYDSHDGVRRYCSICGPRGPKYKTKQEAR